MVEIVKVNKTKKPSNPTGVVYELYINGVKKRDIPKSNLGSEIKTAEENRKRYQERADTFEEIRDQLKNITN